METKITSNEIVIKFVDDGDAGASYQIVFQAGDDINYTWQDIGGSSYQFVRGSDGAVWTGSAWIISGTPADICFRPFQSNLFSEFSKTSKK